MMESEQSGLLVIEIAAEDRSHQGRCHRGRFGKFIHGLDLPMMETPR